MENRNIEKMAYSVLEACEALGIGKTAMYSLINKGVIRSVKLGGRTLIPVSELKKALGQ